MAVACPKRPESGRVHIDRAAQIRDTSISDFVVLSADEAAIRTIREQDVLRLSERDRKVFVDLLLNPPAPSACLVAAAKRYKQRKGRR